MHIIFGWSEKPKRIKFFGFDFLILWQFKIVFWFGKTGKKPTLKLNFPFYKFIKN